ncbi:MAG: fibronectin type III domain-containing protein [archaeon]
MIIALKNKKMFLQVIVLCLVFSQFSQAISDSNSSNNNKYTSINITQNKDSFHILYVYVRNSQDEVVTPNSMNEIIRENNNFLNKVYPLKDNSVFYNTAGSIQGGNTGVGLTYRLSIMGYTSLLSGDSLPDVVVGVLPRNSLHDDFGQSANVVGWSPIGIRYLLNRGVLIEDVDSSSSQYEKDFTLVAHETGHNYGLCDETNSNWYSQDQSLFLSDFCPNGDTNNDDVLDANCTDSGDWGCKAYTFRELHPYDDKYNAFSIVDNQEEFRNIMGYSNINERWIDKETYLFLTDKLAEEPPQTGPGLLISLFVYKNGSSEIKDSIIMDNLPLEDDNSNDNYTYSIKLYNINNTLLFQKKVQPSYIYGSADGNNLSSNVSLIMFAAPFNSSLKYIQFINNGTLQKQVNRSSNTPSISLLSPLGGERINSSFNVSWDASDFDNNSLSYFVQVSSDNGSTWLTVAVDLNSTNITLNNADFSYGITYKIKVYVSDGINTNSSASINAFTIIPPSRISVNSISELSNNGSNKVYEVEIENTGGYNLTNLSWRFNTGTYNITNKYNASLIPNQKMKVILQVNYTSGFDGWVNVSMYAYDLSRLINDTHFEYFLVNNPVYVYSITKLYNSSLNSIINFVIKNSWIESLSNITWNIDLGDSNVINSSIPMTINPLNKAYVFIDHNYTSHGNYTITVNVTHLDNIDTKNLTITI